MVKLNKIYTRTGDDGTSGLVDGSRAPKHSLRFEAIGAVDEANSAIGFANLEMASQARRSLRWIQNDMFDLGADLATPLGDVGGEDFTPSEMVLRIVPAQVEKLESHIDERNAELQPLTSFVLPGGTEASARLHVARASVRRAERSIAALAAEEAVNPAALSYINRLSDYLFVLARHCNEDGAADINWTPGANR